MTDIGRLVGVSAREAWEHETHDFTPWLSENLDQLGEAIGLKLEAEGTEVAVGPFSADILAKDILGRIVLIENQLEATDHNHLGQILTYLTGLDAEIVIWVATDFREQHLSAINWLNENTNDRFSFFGIRLRVIKIDKSLPAPIFDVLARPNEWERSMQKKVKEATGEFSPLAQERREFWKHYLARHPGDKELGLQISGSSNLWLAKPNELGMVVSIYKAKDSVGVFLRGQRGVSASETQTKLAPFVEQFRIGIGECKSMGDEKSHPWDELKIETDNKENWDEAVDWLHERAHTFLTAISGISK